jgi:hypothetical protein
LIEEFRASNNAAMPVPLRHLARARGFRYNENDSQLIVNSSQSYIKTNRLCFPEAELPSAFMSYCPMIATVSPSLGKIRVFISPEMPRSRMESVGLHDLFVRSQAQ